MIIHKILIVKHTKHGIYRQVPSVFFTHFKDFPGSESFFAWIRIRIKVRFGSGSGTYFFIPWIQIRIKMIPVRIRQTAEGHFVQCVLNHVEADLDPIFFMSPRCGSRSGRSHRILNTVGNHNALTCKYRQYDKILFYLKPLIFRNFQNLHINLNNFKQAL